MGKYSNLSTNSSSFDSMISRFGIVTVMNAKIYNPIDVASGKKYVKFEYTYSGGVVTEITATYGNTGTPGTTGVEGTTGFTRTIELSGSVSDYSTMTAEEFLAAVEASDKYICKLDTLKIANVTVDGPSKTITGGQYSNPLIKFGKSARLEMQDALGSGEAIVALCGGVLEATDVGLTTGKILHFGEDFAGPKTIIGESFFIDQKTGAQVPVKIVFYQFLPDSLFNLSQDDEGDATVFDMNGDLLTTEIKIGTDGTRTIKHGVFYSILRG